MMTAEGCSEPSDDRVDNVHWVLCVSFLLTGGFGSTASGCVAENVVTPKMGGFVLVASAKQTGTSRNLKEGETLNKDTPQQTTCGHLWVSKSAI